MACSFAYIEDNCGCHIGYQLPLKTDAGMHISAYPVRVLNVNGVDLGEASSPSQYAFLWNGDTDNQEIGVLSVGPGSYCFHLSRKAGVIPPFSVLGESVAPPVPDNFNFDYGATDADTTGTPLTESQYVQSVQDVFDNNTELHGGPRPHGGTLVVADFGNGATDKVLFVEVPSTEPTFTKWSVIGDPLQQNQPIDQTFSGSAVWFKTTRAGRDLYLTRTQTTFSNDVHLHR